MVTAKRAQRVAAVVFAACCALVAACAGPGARRAGDAQAGCEALFADVDAAVAQAGVGDAMTARIPGFRYLRVDRLLASFRRDATSETATAFWVARLADLDADARAVEIGNLPPQARVTLESMRAVPGGGLVAATAQCRDTLVADDLGDPARIARLRELAVAPDDYRITRRIAGLYPVTRLPFAVGVRAFERETTEVFALPHAALPVEGVVQRFVPPEAPLPTRAALARRVLESAANPLGIPLPDAGTLRLLALAHAPVLEVDVASGDDRLGIPHWSDSGPAEIDPAQPTLFYRAAHTRVGDRVLLQLVYTGWFPARPAAGPFDLLAGRLDGLVWRVTLAHDGAPLVFDSIHPCGCYHFFFPTAAVRPRPAPDSLDEWRFVPQALPRQADDERVVLRIATRTHYLQRVGYAPRGAAGAGAPYALRDDDALRRLPRPDGTTRSLYGPTGFVAGSERLERFVYWPMGIESPGAMRQWGRHATAFVGRRHFDDPRLIDERFELAQ